jgi:hypothetical protein
MSRPRIRTIKPEALQHRKVGRLSHLAFRLWVCCITQADDEGRMVWDAEQFRILAFGYQPDVSTEKTIMALSEITTAKLVRLYTVGDTDYIDIPSWREHQSIDRPTPSRHPAFEQSVNAPGALVEDSSRTRRELVRDRIGTERNGTDRIYDGSSGAEAPEAVTTTEAPVGEQHQKPKPRKREAKLADAEWLATLKALPVYAGLDIDRELGKADAWLMTPKGRGRTKTRGFVVNWLNHALDEQCAVRPQATLQTMSKAERYGYVDFDKIDAEKKAKGAA